VDRYPQDPAGSKDECQGETAMEALAQLPLIHGLAHAARLYFSWRNWAFPFLHEIPLIF
jgi:hypothetical protein